VTLTAKDVAEITRLLEESSFDELYLELDGLKLSLKRGAAVHAHGGGDSVGSLAGAPIPPAAQSTAVRPTEARLTDLQAGPSPGHPNSGPTSGASARPTSASAATPQDIPAPLLGTFYRAPKPGAPPFVEVGSPVEEDTIIAIIEVMKLMNTVRAGLRGTITEILASDGALVEYGQALMRINKAAQHG